MRRLSACFFILATGCGSSSPDPVAADDGGVDPSVDASSVACSIVFSGDTSATYPCVFAVASTFNDDDHSTLGLDAMPVPAGVAAGYSVQLATRPEVRTYLPADATMMSASFIPPGVDPATGSFRALSGGAQGFGTIEALEITSLTQTGSTTSQTAYHFTGSFRATLTHQDGSGSVQMVATF